MLQQFLIPIIVLLTSLGCTPSRAPAGVVSVSPQLTLPPTNPSPAVDIPLTDTLSSEPTQSLDSETGPWLVIITPDALWKIRSDGMGLTKLFDGHILAPQDVSLMPSPAGGIAAFITGSSRLRGLTLNILNFQDGLVMTVPLISLEFEADNDTEPGSPEVEAARALIEQPGFAWSPDGQKLAFVAVRDGPSSDLYLLELNEPKTEIQAISRLTNFPSQEITPTWSPDGRYILFAGVHTSGAGAGQDLAGIWALDTRTNTVHESYTPSNTGAETFVGWQDENTFLVHSWTAECGGERLRMVDVPSGETRPVWEGAFNGVAFDRETGNGSLLLTIDNYSAICRPGAGPGLVLLYGPEFIGFDYLLDEEAFLSYWSPTGKLFFARTAGSVYGIEMDADVINIHLLDAPAPTLPSASRWAERLSWALPSGVWVGGLTTPSVQIFTTPASLPTWGPDWQTLFFVAEEGLYLAHAPEFTPYLVAEGLLGTGAYWVFP